MNKGIIYILGGKKYAEWGLKSVISLRQNGGKAGKLPVHIHFMGDYEYADIFNSLGCSCILHKTGDKLSHRVHRKMKSYVMEHEIPFERYVMIDADTFVQGEFIELFDLIPEDGVAGIEDGNFENHLQMAKFLFLKSVKSSDVRETVKELLGVDYGNEEEFPPYFNVGVIGLTQHASQKLGEQLCPLLERLERSKVYNSHDEQLPMNSIMYHEKIPAIAVDPIFNYTRSRMKKNKKSGLHEKLQEDIRIIHNRSYPKEATWVDQQKVNTEFSQLLKLYSKR